MRLVHGPQEAAVYNGKTPDRCLSRQETRLYAMVALAESVQETRVYNAATAALKLNIVDILKNF